MHAHHRERNASKRQCLECLRSCGFGLKRICRALDMGQASVSRYLHKRRLPVSKRTASNGRTVGQHTKSFLAQRKINVALTRMRHRVQRCIAKFPPKHTCPRPPAMTSAVKFARQYNNNPAFRLRQLLRSRMKKVLLGLTKSGKSVELIGCSYEQLRAHIQRQFTSGMHWNNMGTGDNKWHVDHIVPCAAFDLSKPMQQRICFHYTNLRPMWSLDNIRKGASNTHPQLLMPL